MSFSVMVDQLSGGMWKSLGIFFLTLLFSLPLGLIVCFGRMCKNKIVSSVTGLFISIMRGTPLMLQLIAIKFAPYYIWGAGIRDWEYPAIIVGFSINYAAYFAEIYRTGIEAIPVGQDEAGYMLGYNKFQIFFRIKFPQVIKIIIPSMTNEIITLVKDTSLAFCVDYVEMFALAKSISAAQTSFTPFIIAAAFYYVFNLIVSVIMRLIEKKLSYY